MNTKKNLAYFGSIIVIGLIIIACLSNNDSICDGTLRVSISIFLCVISIFIFVPSCIFHIINICDIKSVNKKLTTDNESNLFKLKNLQASIENLQANIENLQTNIENLQTEKEFTFNRLKVFYNLKMKKENDKEFSKLYKEYQEFVKLFEEKKENNPT
jgi:cell division protein FtsB